MNAARSRAELAHRAALDAEYKLRTHWQPWRVRIRQHRPALLVVGGFASGIALATLPTTWWSRIGGVLLSGSARLARSTFAPALLGVFWKRALGKSDSQHAP